MNIENWKGGDVMKIENRVLLELQQINKNLFELNKRSQDILTALQPKIFEMIQPI